MATASYNVLVLVLLLLALRGAAFLPKVLSAMFCPGELAKHAVSEGTKAQSSLVLWPIHCINLIISTPVEGGNFTDSG